MTTTRKHVFEKRFTVSGDSLLRDHRVAGVALLPPAACVEMALAAVKLAADRSLGRLYDLEIAAPLWVPDDGAVPARLELTHQRDGALFQLTTAGPPGRKATLHARGRLRPLPDPPPPPLDLVSLAARCAAPVPLETGGAGLTWGPTMRYLASIQRIAPGGEGDRAEALVTLEPPPGALLDAFGVHPALLEAAFHAAAAQLGAPALLASLSTLDTHAPLRGPARAVIRRAPSGRVDMDLCSPDGVLLVQIRDVRLRPLPERPEALPAPLDPAPLSPPPRRSPTPAPPSLALPLPAVPPLPDLAEAPRQQVVEQQVVEAIAASLGVRAEHLRHARGFRELGIDSMMAVEITGALNRALGLELKPRLLFDHPSISELAGHIAQHHAPRLAEVLDAPAQAASPLPASASAPAPAPSPSPEPAPPAPARAQRLSEVVGRFAAPIPMKIALRGPLEERRLQRALDALIERHAALRAAVVARGDRLDLEEHAPRPPGPLRIEDLTALPPGQAEDAIARALRAEGREPLDLARGPLLRASLHRLAAEQHILLLTADHHIVDYWSIALLLKDLAEAYRRAGGGGPPPPPARSFREFLARMEERLAGPEQREASAYWRGALIHGEPLPEGLVRPGPAASRVCSSRRRRLPRLAAVQLAEAAAALRGSLPMLLLAMQAVAVHRLTGADDLLLWNADARRDLDGGRFAECVGCIVQCLPIRVLVPRGAALPAVFERVRQACLEAYQHRIISPRALRELAPGPRVTHTFEVSAGEGHAEEGLAFQAGPLELRLEAFDAAGILPEEVGELLFVTFPVGGGALELCMASVDEVVAPADADALFALYLREVDLLLRARPAGARTEESRS